MVVFFNQGKFGTDNITHLDNGGFMWNTGVAKGCKNNCATVQWMAKEDSTVEFKITGNATGYIAVAISSNQAMVKNITKLCLKFFIINLF